MTSYVPVTVKTTSFSPIFFFVYTLCQITWSQFWESCNQVRIPPFTQWNVYIASLGIITLFGEFIYGMKWSNAMQANWFKIERPFLPRIRIIIIIRWILVVVVVSFVCLIHRVPYLSFIRIYRDVERTIMISLFYYY